MIVEADDEAEAIVLTNYTNGQHKVKHVIQRLWILIPPGVLLLLSPLIQKSVLDQIPRGGASQVVM